MSISTTDIVADGVINPRTLERLQVYRYTRPVKTRPPGVGPTKLTGLLLREQRITSRDLQIMELLYNARPVLSRDQIHRLFWPGRTWRAANARLLKLYEYHLLDRNPGAIPLMGNTNMQLNPSIAYYLGSTGKKVLSIQRGFKDIQDDHTRAYMGHAAPIMLLHDLCVSEIYTTLWETLRSKDDTDVVWVSEHQAITRNNQGTELVRPDALIVFTSNDPKLPYRHIWLEVELNPRADKLKEKIARYEAAMTEGVWRGRFAMDTFPEVAFVMKASPEQVKAALLLIRQNARQVRWRVQSWPVRNFFAGWQVPGE